MKGTAIVVGAGIGGLAAAIGLRRVGWDVTVLERARALGEIGAGLSLAPNALRALDALGVGRDVRARGVPSTAAANVRTPSGTWLMRPAAGSTPALLGFHRADLHDALREHVPAAAVRTGAEVVAVDDEPGAPGVAVTYRTSEGERRAGADLVIGADGIHSTVRVRRWPDAPAPGFRRLTCWRGVTEPGVVWPVDGFQTMGLEGQFGVHPVGGRRVYWFLSARAAEPGRRYEPEMDEVRRRVGAWHDPIPALLDATPAGAVLHHDLSDMEPLATYVRGRAALLGDAAHAMLPHRGQGACQAIEDAVVLAAALAGAGDIAQGLARYDAERRPRTRRIARSARQAAAFGHPAGPIAYRMETLLIALMPNALVQRSADAAFWSWSPPPLYPSAPVGA